MSCDVACIHLDRTASIRFNNLGVVLVISDTFLFDCSFAQSFKVSLRFTYMKTLGNIFSLVISFLSLAYGLPSDKSFAAASCPVNGITMSKVELYFGLSMSGGGRIDPVAWQRFVDQEVTPRFPNGLTIEQVWGQWRDVKTGKTIQEPSHIVMILYKPSIEAERAIEDIRLAYKSQFQQDSVMRLDEINCVSF